jgi:hypothetical protein
MEDKIHQEEMDLPDDWWRYTSTCQILSDWFIHHLLGLFLSLLDERGRIRHGVLTGFLLYHQDILLWITAGHVIDSINAILSNPHIKVLRMRWLDGCEIPGAESVPVHNRNLKTFSTLKSKEIDFGVAAITGLDAENILRNDRVQTMTEQVWKNLHLAQPEGYYVLGFPEEWVEIQEDRLPDNIILGSAQANLACLPVRRIDYRGPSRTKEFWNDPGAFYGQILPFVDEPGYQPQNIEGMSGGPVFAIERDSGGIRYRLFGIQRSQDKDERLIRVEPIQRIIAIMEEE